MSEIGIYFRAMRDGDWQSVDISELSENEINHLMSDKSTEYLSKLIWYLLQDDKRLREALQNSRQTLRNIGHELPPNSELSQIAFNAVVYIRDVIEGGEDVENS